MQTIGLDAATITYFLAGLIGSLARVLVGTTQGNWSRRTIADLMGAPHRYRTARRRRVPSRRCPDAVRLR